MQQLLAYLPFLACPVGMGLMMWMMRGGNRDAQTTAPPLHTTPAMTPGQHRELSRMRAELHALPAQNERAGSTPR